MIWNNEKMAVNLPLQNLNGSQHPRPCFDSGLWHGFRIKLLNNDSKIHPKVSSVTYFLFVYLKSLVFQISLHDLPWNDPLQFRWEKHKVSPRQDHLDAPPGTPSSLSPGSSTGHIVHLSSASQDLRLVFLSIASYTCWFSRPTESDSLSQILGLGLSTNILTGSQPCWEMLSGTQLCPLSGSRVTGESLAWGS